MRYLFKIVFWSFISVLVLFSLSRAEKKALVINAEATIKYLELQKSEGTEIWSGSWSKYLRELGWIVEIGDESKLLGRFDYDILVLPNVVCLGDEHIIGLKKYLATQGSLLITGALGARTMNGEWRGFSLLKELLNSEIYTRLKDDNALSAFRFRSGLPITHKIPPGLRMKLKPQSDPLYLKESKDVITVAYWSDPVYRDIHPDSIGFEVGFALKELLSGERIAWMGANFELPSEEISKGYFSILFADLVRWLDGEGFVGISNWPKGKNSACLISGDIEDNFDAIVELCKVFKRLDIRSNYNLLFNEAIKNPNALNAIIETNGEIGIHGDDHSLFKGMSVDLQMRRLNNAIQIAALWNISPKGFRPPELAYDENTLIALKNLNFLYLLADDNPDRDFPKIISLSGNRDSAELVLFPKSELDDYDLTYKMSLKDLSIMTQLMLSDFRRIKDERGLYKLNYHTQYLNNVQFIKVLETVINKIKSDDEVWIASAEQISQWVLAREKLTLSCESKGKTQIISLRNGFHQPVSDIVLFIEPPKGLSVETMRPVKISRDVTYDVKDNNFILYIPKLSPDEHFTAQIEAGAGPSLSDSKKQVLISLFKAVLVVAALFIIWFIYYLVFAKRRFAKIRIPEPDAKIAPDVNLEIPNEIIGIDDIPPSLENNTILTEISENQLNSKKNKVIKRLEKKLKKQQLSDKKPLISDTYLEISNNVAPVIERVDDVEANLVVRDKVEAGLDKEMAPIESEAVSLKIDDDGHKEKIESEEVVEYNKPSIEVKSGDFKLRVSAPLPNRKGLSPKVPTKKENTKDVLIEDRLKPSQNGLKSTAKEPEIYRSWREVEQRFVRTSIDIMKQKGRDKLNQNEDEWL